MKRSLLLLLALGACVAPPKPVAPPVVAVPPAPVLPPPPIVAWEDRARTPGDWTLTGDAAQFGVRGGAVTLSLRCVRPEIRISYPAALSSTIVIRTTTLARSLPLTNGQARLPASDALLDAIIYSRGRFMVSAAGRPDLIIPPWPEIARVVEDCRN